MPTMPDIRQLQAADAAAFRALRLAGLLEAPTAFGSSHDAEKDRTVEEFSASIERNYLAGAFVGGRLVGVVGFYQSAGEKSSHRGNIWGVYVDPAHREAGIARALMENVLAHARGIVSQVHLCVVTENDAALGLYRRLGFVSYGVERRALRVDGRFYDEELMVWRAD